jgi:peptide/nickel transport system substrate-binding protein/oligopeptide transport system substrate-binding protein
VETTPVIVEEPHLQTKGANTGKTPQSQGSQPQPENSAGSAGAEPALPESRDEITIAFSSQTVELDFRKSYFTSEAQIFTALYEGLFTYHPITLEPVPAMAERWVVSEDKKNWTFTIRQNARYSNGDPVRAEDFRAAWLSVLSPENESPYSSLLDIIEGARDYRNGIIKDPEKVGITVTGARTLVVQLNSPASFFPAMLCHHSFSPIHPSMMGREVWASYNPDTGRLYENWTPPVSNGSFQITKMDQKEIILEKNNFYWDIRRVGLNRIIVRFTEDGDESANLWNSRQAHWIAGDVNFEALTDLSGIQVNAMFATHYYYIRSAEKPWDNHLVRRALSVALPWNEIREDHYLPAKTLIFPITGYPEIAGTGETNVEEARRLLTEAGYPGGAGLPELVIRLTPSPDAARIGGLMARAWKEELGVPVRVQIVPYNRYFQAMKEDGYVVGSITWVGDFADPYTFLQMWRRDSNLNDARYSDEDFERLMERSMNEEGGTRLATLAQAEQLLLDRGVVLPISYAPAINIINTNEIDGWYPNALDIHPFKYFSFKAARPLPGVVMAR